MFYRLQPALWVALIVLDEAWGLARRIGRGVEAALAMPYLQYEED